MSRVCRNGMSMHEFRLSPAGLKSLENFLRSGEQCTSQQRESYDKRTTGGCPPSLTQQLLLFPKHTKSMFYNLTRVQVSAGQTRAVH